MEVSINQSEIEHLGDKTKGNKLLVKPKDGDHTTVRAGNTMIEIDYANDKAIIDVYRYDKDKNWEWVFNMIENIGDIGGLERKSQVDNPVVTGFGKGEIR